MRRSRWMPASVLPAVAAALLTFPAAASAVTNSPPNLIKNPDAEAGPGSGNGSTVAVPDWTVPAGGTFTAVKYGAMGGFPTASDPGPQARGANFFAGGPDSDLARADQTISLKSYAGTIAAGASFTLSAWLGGWKAQDDNTTVTIAWEKNSGAFLGAVMIGPVSAADRHDKTGLLHQLTTGTVPHGTQRAVVNVEMSRNEGSYNDGYADNLSLTIKASS